MTNSNDMLYFYKAQSIRIQILAFFFRQGEMVQLQVRDEMLQDKDHLAVVQLRGCSPVPVSHSVPRAGDVQRHVRRRRLYGYCLSLSLVLTTRCTAVRLVQHAINHCLIMLLLYVCLGHLLWYQLQRVICSSQKFLLDIDFCFVLQRKRKSPYLMFKIISEYTQQFMLQNCLRK